jgi:hypothetical protein
MSEADMRSKLRLRLKDLHAKSIENKCERGTPDMAYIGGWMELKWLRGWPAKGGPVAIPHYSNQQRLWLKKHWSLGGNAFLVLQVGKEWLVWAGCDAGIVGNLTKDELYSIAIYTSVPFKLQEFRTLITSPMERLEQIRADRNLCSNVASLSPKGSFFNGADSAKRNTKRRNASESRTTRTSELNADWNGAPAALPLLWD